MQLGHRQIALGRSRGGRSEQLRIPRGLRLRGQLVRLLRRCNLRLPRLRQKLMSGCEVTGGDLRPSAIDKIARCRIVRVQRRDLGLQPFVVIGDFGQRLSQPLIRQVRLFPDDAQQRLGCLLGYAETLADIADPAD